MITTGTESYQWLSRVGGRSKVAHAFIPGDAHSVCMFAVRHPLAARVWQPPGEDRGRCVHCRRELAAHPAMAEVADS